MTQVDINSTHFLFSYGTLTRRDIQLRILCRVCAAVEASLDGYAVKRGTWPYLVAQKDGVIHGMLLTDLTADELARLDIYENFDPKNPDARDEPVMYDRRCTQVKLSGGGSVEAWIYFPVLENWKPEWLDNPSVRK